LWALVVVTALGWTAGVLPSSAQSLSTPVGHVEVSAGVGLLGGATFGEQAASERAGGTGDPYRLFNTETELASSGAFEVRVGVPVTSRFTLEGRASRGRPELRTSISGDAEGAPSLTAVERVDQYLIDGGVVVRLNEWRIWGLVPFAAAGAGYLRELHEGQTLVEDGHLYYVGGGVTHWFFARSRGVVRAAGLRADVRMNLLSGGVFFNDTLRRQGTVFGSVAVVF